MCWWWWKRMRMFLGILSLCQWWWGSHLVLLYPSIKAFVRIKKYTGDQKKIPKFNKGVMPPSSSKITSSASDFDFLSGPEWWQFLSIYAFLSSFPSQVKQDWKVYRCSILVTWYLFNPLNVNFRRKKSLSKQDGAASESSSNQEGIVRIFICQGIWVWKLDIWFKNVDIGYRV